MRIRNGFMLRNIADEWIVIPRGMMAIDFKATILLNETGSLLWRALEKNCTLMELTEQLMNNYSIDAETAKRDIEAFLNKMKSENLLIDE